MPASKRRRRQGSRRSPPPRPSRPRPQWRRRLAWPLVILGAVLFLAGNIGARTGIVMLPFDRHHVFEQFGGALLAVLGLIWTSAR